LNGLSTPLWQKVALRSFGVHCIALRVTEDGCTVWVGIRPTLGAGRGGNAVPQFPR
jgi:hypothetical protein